ncbi:MAG: SPOR domain-containing protein [Phycisphaerales bacterium]
MFHSNDLGAAAVVIADPGRRKNEAVSRPSRLIGRSAIFIGTLLFALALPGGCDNSPKSKPNKPADPPAIEDPFADEPGEPSFEDAVAPENRSVAASGGKWSIVLGTYSQPGHQEMAEQLRQQAIAASGMTAIWVESNERRSIVRHGRYESYDSPAARQDLDRLHAATIGERQPFRGAFVGPLASAIEAGNQPQFHLLQARRLYPGVETLYSLQIGFFEPEPGESRRDAQDKAEKVAAFLRREGELAFYYHGPTMSLVTVGVFLEDAVDPATGVYSPEVLAIQKRHPHNSWNGHELVETIRFNQKEVKTTQPSFLVAIPKSP